MTDVHKFLPKAEPTRGDYLSHMMELQAELQTFLYDEHPADLDLDAKIQFLWTMHTAAGCELVEFMDEVGWKPWASAKFINTEKAQGEIVDVLHFVFSMALAVGLTPYTLYHKYIEKQERNRERQRAGYTGVDEKCLACKRDTADVTVASGLEPVTAKEGKGQYCGECGRGDTWVMPS